MDIFSSRELASLFWIIALFLFLLSKDELVDGLKGIGKAFFSIKMLIPLEALAVYVFLSGYVISRFFTVDISDVKASVLWYLFVGSPLLFTAIESKSGYNPLSSWFKTTFTFVIVVEFLISKYTFTLVVELLLLPIMSLVTMMWVFSENKPEHLLVHKFLSWVMTVFGLCLVYFGISRFLGNLDNYLSLNAFKEFSFPILLSLLTIPFFYAIHIYVVYENQFSRLSLWVPDPKFRKRIKRNVMSSFGLNTSALERWGRLISSDKLRNEDILQKTITEAKRVERLQKEPPKVSKEQGWSPYLAKDFMSSVGVITFDYKEYDGRWHAGSSIIKIREGVFSNFAIYHIDGSEAVADSLQLKLTLNDQSYREADLERFDEYLSGLLTAAAPEISFDEFKRLTSDYERRVIRLQGYDIKLEMEVIEAPNFTIEEYTFDLSPIAHHSVL